MIRNSNTWALLQRLKPVSMYIKDMSEQVKEKAKDTADYSLEQDPTQNRNQVLNRCYIAMMAEQIVVEAVHGFLPCGSEDFDNPYSFAYDVVAKDGVRIEVKTHQSDSKWINVHTGMSGDYPSEVPGINLGPFLKHKLSDLIIIFDSKANGSGGILFTPKILAGLDAFSTSSPLVKKSQFNPGYYLSEPRVGMEDFNFHQFTKTI